MCSWECWVRHWSGLVRRCLFAAPSTWDLVHWHMNTLNAIPARVLPWQLVCVGHHLSSTNEVLVTYRGVAHSLGLMPFSVGTWLVLGLAFHDWPYLDAVFSYAIDSEDLCVDPPACALGSMT